MGSVKPSYVKRIAMDIISRYPDMFNADFEHNKRQIEKVADIYTPHMRNMIAGYITRHYKKKKRAS